MNAPTPALTSKAPWTEAEVASLNAYQTSGAFHPFTCGICRDRRGVRSECPACGGVSSVGTDHVCTRCGGHGVVFNDHLLVATQDGWTCPTCDYTQDWSWEWMLNGQWQNFHLPIRRA